jgi:hypothetical protein
VRTIFPRSPVKESNSNTAGEARELISYNERPVGWKNRDPIPYYCKKYLSTPELQTASGTHPPSYSRSTGVSSSGVKAAGL